MDFIFMLSRNDRTVSDCLHVIDLIESLGLRDIGFKDVGVTEASAGGLGRCRLGYLTAAARGLLLPRGQPGYLTDKRPTSTCLGGA